MPDPSSVLSGSNVVDFQQQTVVDAEAWFKLSTPLKEAIPKFTDKMEVGQRGVRFRFVKSQAGGFTAPTLNQPDFNRSVPMQTDSMYAQSLMLVLPMVIDLRTLNDAQSGKEDARISLRKIFEHYTSIFAKRVEYAIAGNGSGALAYAGGTISSVGAATLTCETAASTTPGHTKGAIRLKKNNWYQAWDESTALPRGTFYVTSEGTSTCGIVVTSGTITSGDPITDVGAFMKFPRGLTHLLDDSNRILQGRDTSVDTILNTPVIDLNGTKFTTSDFETMGTILATRNGEESARNGLTWITTPGLMSDLRKQQFGFRRYMGNETIKGVARKYEMEDGSTMLEAADFDEDRAVGFKNDVLKYLELMPFGVVNPDNQEFRMILGANQTGSILNQKAWGIDFTLAIKDTMAGVLVKRASLSGIVTQVSSNAK